MRNLDVSLVAKQVAEAEKDLGANSVVLDRFLPVAEPALLGHFVPDVEEAGRAGVYAVEEAMHEEPSEF